MIARAGRKSAPPTLAGGRGGLGGKPAAAKPRARAAQDRSTDGPPPIGARLAALRRERGLTLAALARRAGISEATLSRVENGAVTMNAHNLYILAKVLDVDITTFFRQVTAPMRSGLRSITRSGAGERGETARYAFELLCADVSAKRMVPSINTVSVRSLEDAGGLQAHEGEELVFVLEGAVEIHTDAYRAERLETGDAMYFDSNMPHAYVAVSDGPARILVVTAIEPGTPIPGQAGSD